MFSIKKIFKQLSLLLFLFLIYSISIYSQAIPYLQLISPNGGENWEANSTQIIKWESSGIQNIKIEYSLSSGFYWNTITSSFDASLNEYKWVVPNVQTAEVLIRISDASNPSNNDISDNIFRIFIKTNKQNRKNK